ncbi:metallophosphoesterase [uncultured Amnibacterium sp.]|uniref:metallophosphoesterase n=1 Tax=uncultured Amnibacterium sp. TaxID=1631851 RepID=UPI0035C959BE
MPVIRRAGGAAVVGAAGAGVWGTLIERTAFTLRRHTVRALPAGAPELNVLHISDLHMAPWQRKKQRFVRELGELAPDLVIDTGDNLGHDLGLLGLKAALEPFRGVPGLTVWGSNDYWAPEPKNPLRYFAGVSMQSEEPRRLDTDAAGEFLAELGWSDLNNAATRLTVRGVTIDAVGVDDPHRGYDELDEAADQLTALRSNGPADLTIGVAHAPYRRVLDAFTADGADLLFAGHTHGGQVCVPGYGALVTNCDIPREQVKGLSTWTAVGRTARLHVSAGLGTSIWAPVRFACRPEATLLTLTS